MLEHFLEHKLKGYAEKRNDPNQDLASNLSPYLHFGQVGDSSRPLLLYILIAAFYIYKLQYQKPN